MNGLELGAVLASAGLVTVATWRRPPALVGLALIVCLFVRTLDHFSDSSLLGSMDDVFVLIVVVRAVLFRLEQRDEKVFVHGFPGGAFAICFALLGLVGGFTHAVEAVPLASGAYLALKGVAFGWAVAQFRWKVAHVRVAWRWGCGVAVAVGAGMLLNIAAPGWWARTFSVSGGPIERYGLPSLFGPFVHPFDLAFASSMLAVAAAAFLRVFGRRSWAVVVVAIGLIGTVLSLRRKDLLGVAGGLFILVARLRRPGWLIAGALILPILLVANWSFLAEQVQDLLASYASLTSREARTVLTLGGIHLAVDNFPLGAGFGRYASRTAAVYYSPEYFKLGINTTYGLGPGEGQGAFLTDTSWPAILGETGFVGTAAFCAMLIAFAMRFKKWASSASQELQWVGFTGLSWLTVLLFESTGASVFSSPPMFAFLPALVGVGASLSRGLADQTPEQQSLTFGGARGSRG